MADTPPTKQNQREAAIVDRHLPDGYTASPDALGTPVQDGSGTELVEGQPEESSLTLQGGDIHRDIFKIKARVAGPRRAATFSETRSPLLAAQDGPTVPDVREPGGFRRHYLNDQVAPPGQIRHRRRRLTGPPATRNFISFLELYGDFAGENLRDTDDEDDDDDESAISDEQDERRGPPSERRPLLGRKKTSKRMKREGDATTMRTFFTLIKAFVGTGIMFLPKAFRNGGILFSSITLITVSIVTTISFRLLLQVRGNCGGGGYGELGGQVFGPRVRALILSSITLSQLGFVCAGIIFTAENLLSFCYAIANATKQGQPFGTDSLIAIQFIVLIPLALIRNISKLGPVALLADVFILIGLVYIWYYDVSTLVERGMAPSVVLFNPSAFTLTIGSAIFTFEGIGLILPIQSSMKKPEHFSYLLYLVMFIITVIFTSVGALCYATFGDETKIQIISNFPQDSKLVNAVQFIYSLAVLAGEPVQLFPAVRIIETTIFGDNATGKKSAAIKWKKNALRSAVMILCGLVSIMGASDLDKFVALIGSFACVPLVYIYPPLLHYHGVAQSKAAKAFDVSLMVLGVVAMAYTTSVTVLQWAQE